jgi:hypothetical protein
MLLTQRKAAEFLGVSERTLERWRVTGAGPPYLKRNRCVRYLLADLINWAEAGRRHSTSEDGHE